MIAQWQFAFGITGPILILLLIGLVLRNLRVIDKEFVTQANAIVFNVALPVMLFFAVASQPIGESMDMRLTVTGITGTLALVGLLLVLGRWIAVDKRGVFVQGAYRGNLGILGMALTIATYGEAYLAVVGVYVAFVTTVYNVVAVWLLKSQGALLNILRNPIILGIVAGAVVSALELHVPQVLSSTGRYLSNMTLPVALICIGASVQLGSLRSHAKLVALAVSVKLILSPIVLLGIGFLLGVDREYFGILFFMAASPTASASYIMARQMTQHGPLAAEIVAVTTVFGVISFTVGIVILHAMNLV